VPFGEALVGPLPLYVILFVTVAFTVLFPDVVLWLPKMLLPQSVGCFPNPSGHEFPAPAGQVGTAICPN